MLLKRRDSGTNCDIIITFAFRQDSFSTGKCAIQALKLSAEHNICIFLSSRWKMTSHSQLHNFS